LTIALPARAKLNLDLAVIRRREDGFHDVRTTLQAIDLHDLITLTPARTTTLTISGLNVTAHGDNSVLKAHAALEAATKQKLPTTIHLHKRIPPGSGMGGASSDAAATLRGLAALHHITIDLTSIAGNLGADVPFFLTGGAAIAEQRGDLLTPIPTQPQWFAIAWPEFELLTPDVYRAWDKMPGYMPNQLARAAMSIEPRLEDFANVLNKESKNWQMTGSGSAFFRTAAGENDARKATEHLKTWNAVAEAIGPWT
jgi:4-diphosphocytidyl-2-C-methyl-D-erythritol kinase